MKIELNPKLKDNEKYMKLAKKIFFITSKSGMQRIIKAMQKIEKEYSC